MPHNNRGDQVCSPSEALLRYRNFTLGGNRCIVVYRVYCSQSRVGRGCDQYFKEGEWTEVMSRAETDNRGLTLDFPSSRRHPKPASSR